MQSTIRRAASAAAIALTVPALVAAGPAAHAPAYDEVGVDASEWSSATAADPGNGIYPIGGSGQLNGEFVIAERNDVQIGLRITDRTDGLLEAQGKHGVGRYEVAAGFDTGTNNRAEWNYDWHVDLRGSGTTLADYDLTLDTDIADSLHGDATPIDLKFPQFFGGQLDNAVLYQSSQNPVFGNDTFDPQDEGRYQFRLTLKPKDGGPSLSVKTIVTVGS